MATKDAPVTGAAVSLRRPLAFNRAAIPDAATVTGEELAVIAKRHQRTLAFFANAKEEFPNLINMRRLISRGIDLHWIAEDGDAPLHVALRLNDPYLVKELLAAGADPNQRTRAGQTPLSLAIDLGLGIPGAMLLIQGGAKPNDTSVPPADPELEQFKKEEEFWPGTRRKAGIAATPVHDALHRKDIALAAYLGGAGADLNALSSDGNAPLHIMLKQNDMAAAKQLLELGADASVKTADGVTPLSLAIDGGLGLEGVKLLLGAGADITATSASLRWDMSLPEGFSGVKRREGVDHDAVQDALRAKDIELAKFLIENGAPPNGSSGDGSTPLVVALQNEDLAFTTWLLDHGADPNACGVGGDALLPLQAAQFHYDTAVMQMLVDRGAKIDVQDNDGDTALHFAVACSHTRDVAWLLDQGAHLYLRNKYNKTPLLVAIEGHNSLHDSADILIARDPDLMQHWREGKHAIHTAAESFEGERVVIKLLQYSVPARLPDDKGHTPLYHAAFERNGTAEALIYAGALKGASQPELDEYKARRTAGKEGYPYWHWDVPAIITHAAQQSDALAASAVKVNRKEAKTLSDIDRRLFMSLQKQGSGEYAATLVKAGANLNARNEAGQTPLIFACMNDAGDGVCEYLAKNSDLLAVDDNGMSALHYAVQHTELANTVHYLVCNGADVDAQDKIYGRTALMFAIKGGNYIDFLTKRDADIALTDKLGLTAREIAVMHRCEYTEEKLAKVEEAAKTTPRHKRTKPRRHQDYNSFGSGRTGLRFGGGLGSIGGW